jgi:hypothetical protein
VNPLDDWERRRAMQEALDEALDPSTTAAAKRAKSTAVPLDVSLSRERAEVVLRSLDRQGYDVRRRP